MNRKIFISTGEVSGDLHGSLLANALFNEAEKRSVDLEICGLGGERMRKEGVKILQDTTSLSAIGICKLNGFRAKAYPLYIFPYPHLSGSSFI